LGVKNGIVWNETDIKVLKGGKFSGEDFMNKNPSTFYQTIAVSKKKCIKELGTGDSYFYLEIMPLDRGIKN